MISRLSTQGGRRYQQMGSSATGIVSRIFSIGTTATAVIVVKFRKTLSRLGTKVGVRQSY